MELELEITSKMKNLTNNQITDSSSLLSKNN